MNSNAKKKMSNITKTLYSGIKVQPTILFASSDMKYVRRVRQRKNSL